MPRLVPFFFSCSIFKKIRDFRAHFRVLVTFYLDSIFIFIYSWLLSATANNHYPFVLAKITLWWLAAGAGGLFVRVEYFPLLGRAQVLILFPMWLSSILCQYF